MDESDCDEASDAETKPGNTLKAGLHSKFCPSSLFTATNFRLEPRPLDPCSGAACMGGGARSLQVSALRSHVSPGNPPAVRRVVHAIPRVADARLAVRTAALAQRLAPRLEASRPARDLHYTGPRREASAAAESRQRNSYCPPGQQTRLPASRPSPAGPARRPGEPARSRVMICHASHGAPCDRSHNFRPPGVTTTASLNSDEPSASAFCVAYRVID